MSNFILIFDKFFIRCAVNNSVKFIKKNFYVLDKNLTYYRQSEEMISANFKFLSFAWWKRRKQAHDYVKYFFFKNNVRHLKNLDYMLTDCINFFIK